MGTMPSRDTVMAMATRPMAMDMAPRSIVTRRRRPSMDIMAIRSPMAITAMATGIADTPAGPTAVTTTDAAISACR